MKKVMSIFTVLCLLFLCSCGEKAPQKMSTEVLSAGKSVVRAVDDYIDGKIDYDAASTKIDGLRDTMDDIIETSEKDEYGTIVNYKDSSVSTKSLSLSLVLMNESHGHATYDELLSKRNELAELVGMDERK